MAAIASEDFEFGTGDFDEGVAPSAGKGPSSSPLNQTSGLHISTDDAEMDVMIRQKLKGTFGFSELRNGQLPIMRALLRGESALAVFPTGAGKSLCYQLPALLLSFTVIICPLIALMEDQVKFLKSKGVRAAFFNSTLSYDEEQETFRGIANGDIQILYIAPERLQKESFVNRISATKIDMLVIDEAHCVSEWGHAFRPDYLLLAPISKTLQVGRVLCATATATPRCAQDIMDTFHIPSTNFVKTDFYRPNLHLHCIPVCTASEKFEKILQCLEEDLAPSSVHRGSGIVYCTLQIEATQMAERLSRKGFTAKTYHAGMRAEDRLTVQNWFMTKDSIIKIVCATIAFGMGVDKPDIRFVYHATLAKSIEGFAQEIGRAGRDGEPSICRTFLSGDDLPLLKTFATGDTPSLSNVRSFLTPMFINPHIGGFNAPGTVVELNHTDVGQRCDMRPGTMNLVFCHLQVFGGYVKQIGQVRKSFQGGGERIHHQYRILKVPRDWEELCGEVFERQGKRERDELRRLKDGIDLFARGECYSKQLRVYFGEKPESEWKCGNCQVCVFGAGVPIPPQSSALLSTGEGADALLKRCIQLMFDPILGHTFSNDEYRCGVRFLFGMASPIISKARLKNHELHGALERCCVKEFGEVLEVVQAASLERGILPGNMESTMQAMPTKGIKRGSGTGSGVRGASVKKRKR
ncbi:P-loop containing nucleoside triphosphate hydrolase protein [Chytriomyces sp. MP71]|nr:P-loop containing nucleoside triphosphate hydrolase protein [Chytriomyces sp. MP71]